jgi:hypothetical protein
LGGRKGGIVEDVYVEYKFWYRPVANWVATNGSSKKKEILKWTQGDARSVREVDTHDAQSQTLLGREQSAVFPATQIQYSTGELPAPPRINISFALLGQHKVSVDKKPEYKTSTSTADVVVRSKND